MSECTVPTARDTDPYLLAAAMAAGAALIWSMGVMTTRLATSADSWQYLVWRSLGVIAIMELLGLQAGKPLVVLRFLRGGLHGWLAAVFMAISATAFIYALKQTTVANAVFLASTAPLCNLILGRLILHERLTAAGIGAIALGLVGLVVMIGISFDGGDMSGNIAAMLSSIGFAGYSIIVRKGEAGGTREIIGGYATMCATLCAFMVWFNGKPFLLPALDISMALLHGVVFIGFGILLFNRAARTVTAVGLGVLAQVETVFAPVWVYLFLGETVSLNTLLGGGLILAGVVWLALAEAARKPPTPPLPQAG